MQLRHQRRSRRRSRSRKRKHAIELLAAVVIVLLAGIGVRYCKIQIDHHALIEQERNNPQIQLARRQRRHERRFIRIMAAPAVRVYRQNHQVLPSIVLAQAIVESDWGNSKLYQVAHNPFGIKGAYRGRSVTYSTVEYIHNKRRTIHSKFRRYPNLAAAINDHDRALSHGFIRQNHVVSYVKDAKLLQRNHYATDPKYANKLINVIRVYHLGRYDSKAFND